MKKSLIVIEYLLKSAVLITVIVLAYLFDGVYDFIIIPIALAVLHPFFWLMAIPVYGAVYALWVMPVAPRGDMSKLKKYLILPASALICAGAVTGAVCFAISGYQTKQKNKEYDRITDEINAFTERADEKLVYIYHSDDHEGSIHGSTVQRSSVFIDYDTMEIAFVVDTEFGDTIRVFKLEQQTDDKAAKLPYSDKGELQSETVLREPGNKLYSYARRSSPATVALTLLMSDKTVWEADTGHTELELHADIDRNALCHEDELQNFKYARK